MDKKNLSDFCTTSYHMSGADHALVTNKKCPKCGGELECNTMEVLTSNPPQYRCKCRKCGYSTSYFCHELNYTYVDDRDFPFEGIDLNGPTDRWQEQYKEPRTIKPSDLVHEDHHDIIDDMLSNVDDVGVTTLPYTTPNTTTVIGNLNGCNHLYDVKVFGGKIVTYCVKCGKIGDVRDQFNSYNFTCTTTPTTPVTATSVLTCEGIVDKTFASSK